MKKIKIIYGLEAVGGGALKHLAYLVSNISKNDFEITVVLSNSRKENSDFEVNKLKEAGAQVIYVPMCRSIHLVKDIVAFRKILKILREGKYDIVHAHSSKAGGLFRLAAYICQIPSVFYTPHCFYFQGKSGIRKFLFLFLEKALARITTGIIVSENEKKEIIKNRISAEKKVININNAIDFDEYQQYTQLDNTLKNLAIPEGSFVVGAVGRLVPQKDWETFVYAAGEVLKKHPETIFIIAGEGDLELEIKKLIFKLGLDDKVILAGYIQQVHKLFAIMDVFVNTSLWEGLPYVFLEAMNYKKPIITTDTGNENTIVHEENGFISPVKDYHAIAEKIIMLIENKLLAVQMGEKGNDRLLRKYSFELFINKHEELYKRNLVFGKSMYL